MKWGNKPSERLEKSIRGRRNSQCKGLLVGINLGRSRKRRKTTVTKAKRGRCSQRLKQAKSRRVYEPGQGFWLLFEKQWKAIEGLYPEKWHALIYCQVYSWPLIRRSVNAWNADWQPERKALETPSFYSPEKRTQGGDGTGPFQNPSLSNYIPCLKNHDFNAHIYNCHFLKESHCFTFL